MGLLRAIRALAQDGGSAHTTFAEFPSTHSSETGLYSLKYSYTSSARMAPKPRTWSAPRRCERLEGSCSGSRSSAGMPRLSYSLTISS